MPEIPQAPDLQQNPLRAVSAVRRRSQDGAFVVFGATGDLTKRKLMPALYSLAADGMLPAGFALVGVGRSEMTTEQFREAMREAANTYSRRRPVDETVWSTLADAIHYFPMDFAEDAAWDGLDALLAELDATRHTRGNRIYYMAVPPKAFESIIDGLSRHSLLSDPADESRFSRVVVEKPFGRDLASARELNADIGRLLSEEQIYRIDHYLGKETVQNIIVLRFANRLFEPIWNERYVESVQITIAETLGMEGRGAFFDEVGVTRDILSNHGLQLLALIAMEPPISLDADTVRDEKVKALRSVRRLSTGEASALSVRGQYGPGFSGGAEVPGYLSEPGVAPDSRTETFAQMLLQLDSWRWAGVPFAVRVGKRLPKRVTEIALTFRQVPLNLFRGAPAPPEKNVLSIRIQPDEGISVVMNAKTPGAAMTMQPVLLDFDYSSSFGAEPPEAYERLIHDVMTGDQTLFTRGDEVEAEWAIVDPFLHHWESETGSPLPAYEAGSWGPEEAAAMAAEAGVKWRRL